MMSTVRLLLLTFLLLPLFLYPQRSKKKNPVPETVLVDKDFHQLKWRNIGPFRGGRSVTSTGVVDQPMTYYMGSTGGGVWKTVDDGITWKNISDGFFKTGTVGAIAVAESNSNMVVVGMGEHAARGVMTSMGNGVYKSMDAGKTWKHIGLENSRHISDVVIDPKDPNIIFISAQGAQYGASSDRGVYRSKDGGATWEKVLFVNNLTGASSLSMDMNNSLILYASMWEHQRFPWTMVSGGEGSGLYKSTDGGTTWEQMKEGLPKEMGKSGISVSRANSDRVYAVLEAEGKQGGVYRSDDGGKKWKQTSKDRINIARSWYYMEIFADPQNEDWVYVLNAPVTKSIDGGANFSPISTPHGDNHHLWIHPNNHDIMINSNDGGANVSNNGGKSWSTQENQPTAQFYRVITDNLVPYNIYGGQQDNSSVSIVSRTTDNGIDWQDWQPASGCESAYLAFDPNNPDVIYGGCYQGIIEKFYKASQQSKSIKEYPELGLGVVPSDFKFRYNWNAPIIASPHDVNTIYHAGNVVFKTMDGGTTWETVSGDLTRNDKTKQGPGGGPFTNEAAGGENYNTIMYLVESPHEKGVLWAGSDDGLVHITKDGGGSWQNVSPAGLGEGIVNHIEVSPHNPATAYVTVMKYKFMDLAPYIYKTTDYGASWTKVVNGISDPHTFVRVVKEDPKKPGLLYAGTETGLYISFDAGANWQPFQLNLPVVAINDLAIQDNDLIAATAGRSFWILDDLSALQNNEFNKESMTLFQPKDTYLLFGGSSDKPVPGIGQNPKEGVTMDYYLPKAVDSLDLTLEVFKGDKLIRTFTNKKPKDFRSWPGGPSKPEVLSSKKGYNRFTWDFRTEDIPVVEKVFSMGGNSGYRVGPGTYTLKLSLDGNVSETTVTVMMNPNIEATTVEYAEQQDILASIDQTIQDMHEAVNQMRSTKSQIEAYKKLLEKNNTISGAKELVVLGDSLLTRIETWEENLIQPKQETFQDVINFNNKLSAQLLHLKGYIDEAYPKVTQGAKTRLSDLLGQWNSFKKERDAMVVTEMKAYNEMYKKLEIPALIMGQ
ncbi:WD40/YVTN/BNR-like repeat-containing protein [Sediminicola sp. YIK13]|uniref:WD40/YVTN/BNR-like repeat-containing protein n=1 Tax=Sediminicola sp. YIK13 TaxID=1453352 RepID=UPI000B0CFB8C